MSQRGHKYGAVPTTVDGIRFASKAEAARYAELRLLEKAGEIKELECQPKFPIYIAVHGRPRHMGDKPVFTYVADFRYRRGPTGILVIEDVKGVKTRMYQLKKKCVEVQYGLTITEIGRRR